MSGRICAYTSFTYAYLSRARILVESLRLVHPEWEIWAILVDEAPPGVDVAPALAGFDGILGVAELEIPRWRAWLFKHDVVEACTAVKGAMLVHLLELGADKVFYFDPDIAVFNPLDDLVGRLDQHSVLLTPHQIAANGTVSAVRDNEITSLQYGSFNLGFVGVRNNREGMAFARWWAAQLYRECYDEVGDGIFTDQKYCDLVPALFGGVHVVRDPGCNVASWNLSRRELRFDAAGGLVVNGSALKFYHFTKIGGAGDVMTERYGVRNIEVFEVWHWYKRREMARRVAGMPAGWWAYGVFADGGAIAKELRVAWRGREAAMARVDDPFALGEAGVWEAVGG